MIIEVKQTGGSDARGFDVFYDDIPKFVARLGKFFSIETFYLSDRPHGVRYSGEFALPSPMDMIPLNRPKTVKNCFIKKNSRNYGTIGKYDEGLIKAHYHIADRVGGKFDAFHFSDNGREFITVYKEDTSHQVALIDIGSQGLYTHYKIYVADEAEPSADTLALFTVYFSNWNLIGRKGVTKRSAQAYSDKFDPTWLEQRFPDESWD